MAQKEEVTQWMIKLSEGDELAATNLWNEYFTKMTRLAKRKLSGMPRRDSDEEDVAVSAMNSFHVGIVNHRFDALHNRDDLWKLLMTITARKATAKLRKHYAQKRGGGGTRGESVFIHANGDEHDGGIGNILGSEPTPEFAADVAENTQVMLNQLGDKTLQQVAQMRLEGWRTEEIAQKLGCARRTIERKLERIREIWGNE